jgi:hypothetical protein
MDDSRKKQTGLILSAVQRGSFYVSWEFNASQNILALGLDGLGVIH